VLTAADAAGSLEVNEMPIGIRPLPNWHVGAMTIRFGSSIEKAGGP
jgi:hypothetical protein